MLGNSVHELVKPERCFGCAACSFVCPVSCITMRGDHEGFLAPKIDETSCINCGACSKVCPSLHVPHLDRTEQAYLAYSLVQTNELSSSGGMATLLSEHFIRKNGVVAGCMIAFDGSAVHTLASSVEAVRSMQGSKYVQSDTSTIWRSCCTALNDGRKLLFIGTPCQVAAARRLFGEGDKAVYVDLICHGVPSPSFWMRDLEYLKQKGVVANSERIQFRTRGKGSRTNYQLYDDAVGKDYPYQEDAYYSAFVAGSSYRESCYSCPFATERRPGDITLGNCATADNYPKFHPDKPVSCVLVNTERGKSLLNELLRDWDFEGIDRQREERANHCLHAPTVRPGVRDSIYQDAKRLNYQDFTSVYRSGRSFKNRVWAIVKRLVPIQARVVVKTVLRRLR